MLGILKYIGALLLCSIGFGQTFLYRKVKKQWATLPEVEGEIVESKLLNHNDLDGNRIYEAQIVFKYRFNGNEFESSTPVLKSPQLFPNKDLEHDLLSRYKVGDMVVVRVLPNRPKLAYLEISPFSKLSAILLPVFTVIYFIVVFGYGWATALIFGAESNPDPYGLIQLINGT